MTFFEVFDCFQLNLRVSVLGLFYFEKYVGLA